MTRNPVLGLAAVLALLAPAASAQVKISNLPDAHLPLAGTEVVPIVQDATTRKVNVNALAAAASGSLLSVNNLSDVQNATTSRLNLGVAIGSNVEAWDADLDALAALTGTNTIYYRSAANTWLPVTIGANLTFSGGSLSATGGGGGGGGTVTTTGTPVSGNLTQFSGATSITNADLSGDCTTSGGLAVTCTKTAGVAFAASATTNTTNAGNISSGTLAAARGGAGAVSGILKANGSGVVSAAASGADYAPATSGSAILYGNGAGGFSNVTTGGNLTFSGGALAATGSAAGVFSIQNGTGTATLQFGGATSAFPAMIASGTTLRARLADDSDWANLAAGALNLSSSLSAGTANSIGWNTRSRFVSSANGSITLFNSTQTGFNFLKFGGEDNTFPSLKRSGTGLEVRLADDSASAPLTASGLTLSGVAGSTQCLQVNTSGVVSGTGSACGAGGGGGSPGGSSGQIQYNNAGAFGGFTMAGDCTLSQPTITCTKTNGTSFGTAATATIGQSGSTVPLLNSNATWSAKSVFDSSAFVSLTTRNIAEPTTVSATAATGTINFDALTQSVVYFTSNASANWTVNLRGDSGTALNTLLATGQAITLTHMVAQGTTAFFNSAVQVDGTTSGVTTKWQGGAPAFGNPSGVDVYTYTVIKTGNAAFTVLASQTPFN